MNRLYFVATVLVLIIIPHTVDSFFLQNLANISVTTNISCYLNASTASPGGFQLCAIRTYYAGVATNLLSFTVYDGLRYMNSLSRFMQNRCNHSQNLSPAGTGQAVCYPIASFETFNYFTICICATNNCNQNLTSCQASAAITMDLPAFSSLTPNITAHTQCNDTLNASITCTEQPFINASLCEDYIKNNSVLCAISINGNITIRTALIYQDYDRYLTEKIYEFELASNTGAGVTDGQTDTNVYYLVDSALFIGECSCTNFSLCNQDINSCMSATQNVAQDTTMITATATNAITAATATYAFTAAAATNAITAATATYAFTAAAATNAFTAATATNAITAAAATNAVTAATSTNAVTAAAATNAVTAATSTNAVTAAAATNAVTAATAANAFTAAASTNSVTAAASTNAVTAAAATNAVTAAASTNSVTAAASTNAVTAAAATNAITAATATNAFTAAAATNAFTAATATNAFTAAAATNAFTAAAATNAFTAAAATNAFTAATNATTAAAATNAFTAATSTNAVTAATATNAITAATATHATAATATNTITNMATNTITTSSNLQSPGSLESGLGSAATAGLVCGIIFSAILFSVEIIFFKFCYHGGTGGGSERSVAYRA